MTEAKVRRMHTPLYNDESYPPLPARIRLAANCWERNWSATLSLPLDKQACLEEIVSRFSSDTVSLKAQMRTGRRMCISIRTFELDDQSEFEIAMLIMAYVHREVGQLERVEDRPINLWPVDKF